VVGVLPEISVLPLATKANCAPFIIASPQLCPFTTTGRSTCGSEKVANIVRLGFGTW
jgi:hypothetical protein